MVYLGTLFETFILRGMFEEYKNLLRKIESLCVKCLMEY